MTLPLVLALVAIVLAVGILVVQGVKVRRRLEVATRLLGNALAAEESAVKCREIGAFDQAQRDEILDYLGRRDPGAR